VRLCALNYGIQLVWGAILAVSLQARSSSLGGGDGVRAYANLAAAGALVATLVQLWAGRASDRAFARRGTRDRFYLAGVALSIPALAWFYLAPTYTQLVAAFVALEIAMNVVSGPYQAVIPDRVARDRRGRASSWMAAYQSLGNACGLVVAGFVSDVRAIAALLASGLLVAYATTASSLRGHIGTLPSDVAHARTNAPANAWAGGSLGVLLISRGLINLGFFTLLGFLLFFVRDSLGIRGAATTTQTALVFLTFTLSAIGGAVAAARPADRIDKRVVVAVAIGIVVAALGVLALATSLPLAYGAAFCAGLGWGAFVTADWALASALLPPASMASAMGIWNVATTVPQIVAPLVAAPLVTILGPRAAIALAICEFVAGAIAIRKLPRV
jgi:MFS family permease